MRCLYCGKPLPLLKKLTGGGEFCSDAHRHKYQEEYNKLALSRLLQAQTAPGETGSFGIPGGAGLRQLAAPAPPPLFGAQRALPPPSNPTAHHQAGRDLFQNPAPNPAPVAPPPAPRALAPPAPAPPPPLPRAEPPGPDPSEAPFLVRRHAPVSPAGPAAMVKPEAEPAQAQARPQFWAEEPALAPVEFDWQGAARSAAAGREPDPPEAPAWRHPLSIIPPVEPRPASGAMRDFDWFASKPLNPSLRAISPATGHPARVRRKIGLSPAAAPPPARPAQPLLTGARDWELKLTAPAWKPALFTVSAPAPAIAVPPGPTAVAAVAPAANVEVFIDLSALGFFDEAPKGGAGGRR